MFYPKFSPIPRFCQTTNPSGALRFVVVIISLTLALVGCESLQLDSGAQKIDEVIIPELRGRLLQAGQPVAGARLRVSQREGEQSVCEIPFAETSSGPQGAFLFPLVNGDLGKNVFERVSNNWQICVATDKFSAQESAADTTEWQQIWYDSHAGIMFGEKFTELDCDLGKLPVEDGKKKSFFSRFKPLPDICEVRAKF